MLNKVKNTISRIPLKRHITVVPLEILPVKFIQ